MRYGGREIPSWQFNIEFDFIWKKIALFASSVVKEELMKIASIFGRNSRANLSAFSYVRDPAELPSIFIGDGEFIDGNKLAWPLLATSTSSLAAVAESGRLTISSNQLRSYLASQSPAIYERAF